MKLDVLGLLGACSYALDCVEAELVHVTNRHAKRVAYMSICTAEKMGVHGNALQDLTACALLHDNALTQYIQEEFHGRAESLELLSEIPHLGLHCSQGEENIRALPVQHRCQRSDTVPSRKRRWERSVRETMAGGSAFCPDNSPVRPAGRLLPRRQIHSAGLEQGGRLPFTRSWENI